MSTDPNNQLTSVPQTSNLSLETDRRQESSNEDLEETQSVGQDCLGQDGAREMPHEEVEEEAIKNAPKRRGRKPKGTMNDVTVTKNTRKDKVTNCSSGKSESNARIRKSESESNMKSESNEASTLDADLVGVRKITTYFTPIPKELNPLSMPKNCFEDCLHNRADEAAGIMTACDACDTWYHHDCVANKSRVRPCKKKVWFCNDCKFLFLNMKNLSKEISDLRNKLTSKSESTVTKQNCISKSSMDCKPQSAKEGTSSKAKTNLKKSETEVHRLRDENSSLKEQLQSLRNFVNQLLDEQGTGKSVQESRPSTSSFTSKNKVPNKQAWKPSSAIHSNNGSNNVTPKANEKKKKKKGSQQMKKVLLLGDSHVRRLDSSKLNNIVAVGLGGVTSSQLIKRHAKTIKDEVESSEEIIIHIGSNDISKGIPSKTVINNIDEACKNLHQKNPDANIAISSILFQRYNPSLNLKIVETNDLIRKYCLTQGWDYIPHGNIGFKHLLSGGMHLNPEGNRLFARNITDHLKLD